MSTYNELKEKRRESDYIMPMWLAFLPIIIGFIGSILIAILTLSVFFYVHPAPTAVTITPAINSTVTVSTASSTVPSFLGLFAAIMIPDIIMGLLVYVTFAYIIYRLIKRFNDHSSRVRGLLNMRNADKGLSGALGEIEGLPRRDPTEWAVIIGVLGIIPAVSIIASILTLYVFHSLNKDFYKLEHIENNAYRQLGWKGERYHTVPDRSTALYIILTIITLGIFFLYWVYTVANDPNEHFREDWKIEDQVFQPASGQA
ncbi:MAG: DUF4234 domain-containing protein [Nitrososphaerota archaeon]|nr:DUF4234 domain-containing protein [Nitrososphaerota archaeon]MDG6936513.1 DUF4234 domain-containing protein [Nitrososphaerota archaeon]MDG6944988.1 DUF4234 domain-containing protein [Nitrososphaerota archaeon]